MMEKERGEKRKKGGNKKLKIIITCLVGNVKKYIKK